LKTASKGEFCQLFVTNLNTIVTLRETSSLFCLFTCCSYVNQFSDKIVNHKNWTDNVTDIKVSQTVKKVSSIGHYT